LGTPAAGGGRLIFALDATMSRQPTWDTACRLQAEMFDEAGKVGGLAVQLVYFRGHGECRASRWVNDGHGLRDLMTGITVRGGQTQIGKVLSHARREAKASKVAAMVFVGDALEEPIDSLAQKAGELGLLGVRLFVFQEGRDATVESGFRELARLSGGAYARFDTNAAGELAQLLRAAAAYAAGGLKALEKRGGGADRLLLSQMRG
ncbi:MAG: VWA domain-containing protein, partial [Rhizobiales bacterium]|nr:VWA domain-containing protein [Hyphomicrobiales bacterium]